MSARTFPLTSLALLTAACSVPNFTFQELAGAETTSDAGLAPDAGLESSDAGAVEPDASAKDAGARRPVRSGKTPTAGAASGGSTGSVGAAGVSAAGGGAGSPGAPPASGGSAGAGGVVSGPQNSAGSAAGASGSASARVCAVWQRIGARDNAAPAGAVEGGFETVTGVTNRQYVCRFQPPGSSFAIPGKYIVGLGCYVTYRRNAQQVDDASMLDGMFEVLTPAPGCTFSWRKATATELPAGVADLGEPAGGRNYACHGDYGTVASNGKQVGTLIPSADNPPQYQCFFESFSNAIQPSEPSMFEVLVQD